VSAKFDFAGRTVLVTGGAQGIGAALVQTFHDAGADVVVADLSLDAIEARWGSRDRLLAVQCDVADAGSANAAVSAALNWTGALDVVINNAGITRDTVVWKMTDEQWQAVIGVHLTGTFNLTRAAVVPMRAASYGRIVNVSSFTGLHGNVGQANYAAAKAGIIGFSKTVAKEVAKSGITVNVLVPNAETAMVAAIPAGKRAEFDAQIPMGRFGDPSEIAPAVAFLASDNAAYITGTVLHVDGGLSM
jgi:3-oxoacyl-[acyl-carrier protein] reductase